jgi:outer membrane protein OmpA-like peptidoglycan-associated protein
MIMNVIFDKLKPKMKKLLLILLCLACSLSFVSQIKIGASFNETIQINDTSNKAVSIKIPNGYYMVLYKHDWEENAKDTKDSVKLVQNFIENIIKENGIKKNIRVICYSSVLNDISFKKWAAYIKKGLFKAHPKYKAEYYCFTADQVSEFLKLAKIGGYKMKVLDPNGRILARSAYLTHFSSDPGQSSPEKKIKGKLLTEESGVSKPLINATVNILTSNKSKTFGKAKTDKFGDFEITLPGGSTEYSLNVQPVSKDVKNVILATQNGVEISRFKKTANGFEYPLLKADLVTLREIEVNDDISITFNKFKTSGINDLKITENIIYGSGKHNIEKQSEPIIDKVVTLLRENPNVKLEIISHTDSQGDDAANLLLSERRSNSVIEYIFSKGIDKGRIKAIGKGESAIRNRCSNGIECSDKEHEYNRRTEFNFTKE